MAVAPGNEEARCTGSGCKGKKRSGFTPPSSRNGPSETHIHAIGGFCPKEGVAAEFVLAREGSK